LKGLQGADGKGLQAGKGLRVQLAIEKGLHGR